MKKVLILSSLTLLLAACGGSPKKADDSVAEVDEVKARNVRVMTIEEDTIEIQQEYTAAINAYDKVYLAPTMPGRIKEVKVEVTDKVQKGQLVVLMDDAQLLQMRVQLENFEKEMERMDTLIQYGSVSQQVYDQTKTSYEANKVSYQNMLENTRLLAPFSGIVTERYFDDNELFSAAPNTQAGKAAVVVIEQITKLKVNVNVSARYFPLVKNGLDAALVTDIYPEKEFHGEVSLVYPTIDPQTRTFTVEITIPNDDMSLRPGMYAKVKLTLGEKRALVVPSSAVLMQDGTANRFVFLEKNGVAQKVFVRLGERFDDQLEILSEMELGGQNIVVAGQSKLENGDKLKVN